MLTALWICLGIIGGLYFLPVLFCYPAIIKKDSEFLKKTGKLGKANWIIVGIPALKVFSILGYLALLSLLIPIGMAVNFTGVGAIALFMFLCGLALFFILFSICFGAAYNPYFTGIYHGFNPTGGFVRKSGYLYTGMAQFFLNFLRFTSPLVVVTIVIIKKAGSKEKRMLIAAESKEKQQQVLSDLRKQANTEWKAKQAANEARRNFEINLATAARSRCGKCGSSNVGYGTALIHGKSVGATVCRNCGAYIPN